MTPEEKQIKIQGELDKFLGRRSEIDKRVSELMLTEPYSVIIERIDLSQYSTFLHTDPLSKNDRIHKSSLGRIVAVSSVKSPDEVIEAKKALVKKDDYVIFNHEVAFHLAIKDFYELWIIHVDNILCVDRSVDMVETYKKTLEKKYELVC